MDTTHLERMLVEPQRTDLARRRAEVVDGDWDLYTSAIEGPWVRFSLEHWGDGVPWSETGAYEYLLARIEENGGSCDGCSTLDDVVRRHEELDRIFEQVRREGRLRTRRELDPRAFRETGGIIVHVGRDGAPIWGRNGSHRIAMAKVLDLPVIPAQVGAVHRRAPLRELGFHSRHPRLPVASATVRIASSRDEATRQVLMRDNDRASR